MNEIVKGSRVVTTRVKWPAYRALSGTVIEIRNHSEAKVRLDTGGTYWADIENLDLWDSEAVLYG